MRFILAMTLLIPFLLSAGHAFCASREVGEADRTALDRYVAAADPSYQFKVVKTAEMDGLRYAAIDLTSQTWLSEKEVDHPVWRHLLLVVTPRELKSTTGMLFIGGGSIGRDAPDKPDERLAAFAKSTGSVVAELKTVPNQPLVFAGETRGRVEDEIIAYTWDKFLRTGDARWPARLPMTKSAVRAMDTITAYCASEAGGGEKVEKFVVAGASKRGWTTWTTAAVDDRVVGIVPIVIDTLNVPQSSAHHLAAYGFFSEALKDYEDMKLAQWAGTPQYAALMRIEDPYSYRARYTMPKLLLNATGDEYFLPDNSQLYFKDLPGPKCLRYVPNADHSLDGSDAAETLLAFYRRMLAGRPLPELSWTLESDGSIRVTSHEAPVAVKLWRATNPAARDFRLETIGRAWTSVDLAATDKQGEYIARIQPPTKGWTAFFVECTYADEGDPPLKMTTQVRVLPEVLPFAGKVAK